MPSASAAFQDGQQAGEFGTIAKLSRDGLSFEEPGIALELPSNEAVRAAVEAGAGATVVSRLVVAAALRAGSLVAVAATVPRRRFYALQHKERYVGRAAQAFLSLLREQAGAAEPSSGRI